MLICDCGFKIEDDEGIVGPETMYELYYSYSLNKFFTITPDIQIVTNPYADRTAKSAVVCGLRFLLSF